MDYLYYSFKLEFSSKNSFISLNSYRIFNSDKSYWTLNSASLYNFLII